MQEQASGQIAGAWANEPGERTMETQEELAWLMSLALDEDLSQDEAERMATLLEVDPDFAAEWQIWQTLDQKLDATPAIAPPPDFAAKFEARLAGREWWRRVRTGILFGLSAFVLWACALLGLVLLSVFFWSNDTAWMANTMQELTYLWATVSHLGETLREAGSALMAAPMARWVMIGYLLLTAGILSGWFGFLRRSLNAPVSRVQ